jgi:flavin-dependent dehydrogenase
VAGALLTGEAVGVDPLTGEGFAHALAYGRLAADTVLAALATGDVGFQVWADTARYQRGNGMLSLRGGRPVLEKAEGDWITALKADEVDATEAPRRIEARGNRNEARTDLMEKIFNRSSRVIWLNPEPQSYWGQGDSVMPHIVGGLDHQ